jgi:hypothetical protein
MATRPVNSHAYTLTQAARAIGMTRQGVLAAIRRGTISASKDELGHWAIDPAELHRVYPPVSLAMPVTSPVATPGDVVTAPVTTPEDLAELQKRLAVAEALLATARDQAESALRERDAWKDQAHEWMRMSQKALPEGDAKPKKRSLLARLFLARD